MTPDELKALAAKAAGIVRCGPDDDMEEIIEKVFADVIREDEYKFTVLDTAYEVTELRKPSEPLSGHDLSALDALEETAPNLFCYIREVGQAVLILKADLAELRKSRDAELAAKDAEVQSWFRDFTKTAQQNAQLEREITVTRELLATLCSEKACSFSFAQQTACKCCHAHAPNWLEIQHTEACDVRRAREVFR